jgi:hypothetical protein
MVKIESELFSQIVKKKSISHPTARNFDPVQWKAAAAKLTNPTERDQQLLAAGIYYGSEIKRLRDHFENRIFERLDRRTGILLTLAMANLNHRILGQKYKTLARKRSRTSEVIDPMAIARQPISSSYPENRAAPDAAVATIVDTIPHCLERAFRSTNSCDPLRNFHDAGSELFSIMSVEHALRGLWQQVLWDGWKLARDADDSKTLRHTPTDRELATLWDVWVWRQEMIMFQGAMLDDLNDRLRVTRGHFIKPFVDPTVVGIGGHSKENRRFRFGSLSGREHGQAWHAAEQTILNECYLTDFLDTPLPKLAVSLSCSDLQTAWRILRDCASVLAARCKERLVYKVRYGCNDRWGLWTLPLMG